MQKKQIIINARRSGKSKMVNDWLKDLGSALAEERDNRLLQIFTSVPYADWINDICIG